MNNLKKHAVSATIMLHLCDAADEPIYTRTFANGSPDPESAMVAEIYGPGSKEYARAQTASSNHTIELMRKKGKVEQTAEQRIQNNAEFLAAITKNITNLHDDEPVTTSKERLLAAYSDQETGFIADQVQKKSSDWANFKKPSPSN